MTEKRQTSQGYIIRILQHFATKLWNITNFVMLFQAVMKFLSRLVEIKILSITQVVMIVITVFLTDCIAIIELSVDKSIVLFFKRSQNTTFRHTLCSFVLIETIERDWCWTSISDILASLFGLDFLLQINMELH
jgi:hypothetical protein